MRSPDLLSKTSEKMSWRRSAVIWFLLSFAGWFLVLLAAYGVANWLGSGSQ